MKRMFPAVLLAILLVVPGYAVDAGQIDRQALLNIAANWRLTGGGPGDFTDDGLVDEADILYVIEHWKQPTSPTATPTDTATPQPPRPQRRRRIR